jgi:cytochrome c oxidase assembly protein subunit 15
MTGYKRYSWFVLIFVFLVILAGGIVRMTQSGMGCPDWPTCFGMWIPPTDASQLPADFEKYLSKQDIDHSFNVYHTWIEYINRLLGALLGIWVLIYVVWTTRKFWTTNKAAVGLSFLMLFATGFQGWLGKLVVDANLAVVKVTIHMLGAIVIAFIPILILRTIDPRRYVISKTNRLLLWTMTILFLVQIILGTQVREHIDEISKSLSYESRELWISRLGNDFVIHRSFSWAVLILAVYLWWKERSDAFLRLNLGLGFGIVCLLILLGVVMAYLDMPAIAQPLHLLLACIGILVYGRTALLVKAKAG